MQKTGTLSNEIIFSFHLTMHKKVVRIILPVVVADELEAERVLLKRS